jgi:hypothetical protein
MKSTLAIVFIILALLCVEKKRSNFDIRGSWYADFGNGGNFDSLVNYGELYITDTTVEIQEERFGQHPPYKYYIEGDSIFTSAIRDSIPMFKIDKFYKDSIFVSVNLKYVGKNNHKTEIWRRLPKGEKGYYDHTWTSLNKDSLEHAIVNDWYRRMNKFHSYRLGRPEYYDSLLQSGTWDWNMKQIREGEEREKEYLRTH